MARIRPYHRKGGPDPDFPCTEKLRYYLLENPKCKEIACLEIFEDKLDFVIVKSGDASGIQIPNVKPSTFKIFTTLISSGCFEDYLKLELSPDQLFDLAEISKIFGCRLYQKGFELLLRRIFENPIEFLKSPAFLNLSLQNVEKILSEDWISVNEVMMFESACSWGVAKCKELGLEETSENVRSVLGRCFFEIRFPWMTTEDFLTVVVPSNIPTGKELAAIFECTTNYENDRVLYDWSNLGFKITKRKRTMTSGIWVAVRLLDNTTDMHMLDDQQVPVMECGPWSAQYYRRLKPWLEAEINAWAGPVDTYSSFKMTVETFVSSDNGWKSCGVVYQKNISPPGYIANFFFRNLVIIEPKTNKSVVECVVKYNVEGPTKISRIAELNTDANAAANSVVLRNGRNFKHMDSQRREYEEGVRLSLVQYRY